MVSFQNLQVAKVTLSKLFNLPGPKQCVQPAVSKFRQVTFLLGANGYTVWVASSMIFSLSSACLQHFVVCFLRRSDFYQVIIFFSPGSSVIIRIGAPE